MTKCFTFTLAIAALTAVFTTQAEAAASSNASLAAASVYDKKSNLDGTADKYANRAAGDEYAAAFEGNLGACAGNPFGQCHH